MRTAIFISVGSVSLRLGDSTINPQYEDFDGYVPPNFRAVDFGCKWQRQWRAFSLEYSFF